MDLSDRRCPIFQISFINPTKKVGSVTAHYVLIDYENTQPQVITGSAEAAVLLFLGPKQNRLPVRLAQSMQALGERGQYVCVEKQGPNALDFLITYYVGVLQAKNPQASFEIVSKDKGFDALIEHLKVSGVVASRVEALSQKNPVGQQSSTAITDAVIGVVRNLNQRGASRPARIKTFENTIRNHLGGKKHQALDVINTLREKQWVDYDGDKVVYALPQVK